MPYDAQTLSLAETLLNGRFLFALLVFAAASVGLGILNHRVEQRLEQAAYAWLWGHLYLPMLRAGVMVLFLFVSHPVIFSLGDAPTIVQLMDTEAGRFGKILGIVFVLSLALPLLPLRIAPALVLPAQGISGAAMLFGWTAQSLGVADVSFWPGAGPAALIVAFSVATHWLSGYLGGALGWVGRRLLDVEGLEQLFEDSGLLLLQAPGIVIYTTTLGAQLLPR